MKVANKFLPILLIILTLGLLTSCVPANMANSGLVLGDTYRLKSGQTINHDLTVLGGNAVLEEDSTVNGDLAVIGGNVTVDGAINGDVSVLGGYVSFQDHAHITGSISSMGGSIDQSSQAVVEGKTNDITPDSPRSVSPIQTPTMKVGLDPITKPLMAIFQALALAALAIVANLFIPKPMERTSHTVLNAAPASGGIGCLTVLVLVIMAITIILLPVSVLGVLAMAFAILFGWLSMGLVLGRQIAAWLNQNWSDPLNAGAGTLILSLLTSLLGVIPCIGWLAPTIVSMVALGAVVLSRFGSQTYPPDYSSSRHTGPAAPPAPRPAPPVYTAPRPADESSEFPHKPAEE